MDVAASARTPAPNMDAKQQLREAADQFEAFFLRELLKPMEDALGDGDGGLFDEGQATSTWRELQHQAIAERAAGSLGVGEIIYRQLAGRLNSPPGS